MKRCPYCDQEPASIGIVLVIGMLLGAFLTCVGVAAVLPQVLR